MLDLQGLEALLRKCEGEELDFKSQQYHFEQAENACKSELLKDILAFANAWKTNDAHILIGVQEVTGDKAVIVGVKEHLDDAKLQEFVNTKTNAPVSFRHFVISTDNRQVGVIQIAKEQKRPIFLKGDFGNLRKNIVYIRRGSSTFEAKPDEIAEMGRTDMLRQVQLPVIELGIGDFRTRETFGSFVQISPQVLDDPPSVSYGNPRDAIRKLKDFSPESSSYFVAEQMVGPGAMSPFRRYPSPEEMRDYCRRRALFIPLAFYVKNLGRQVAHDVRAEITMEDVEGFELCSKETLPRMPRKSLWDLEIPVTCSNLSLRKCQGYWQAELDFGKVQPSSEVWLSDFLYVASRGQADITLRVRIFADNLPEPEVSEMIISVVPCHRVYEPREWEDKFDD